MQDLGYGGKNSSQLIEQTLHKGSKFLTCLHFKNIGAYYTFSHNCDFLLTL